MEPLPYSEYAAQLNRKRIAAGVLFRDSRSRVLLVETSYKSSWEIPGGAVEADEPPWTAAVREVREELGISRPLGRLLAIDYVPEKGAMPEGLAFIFDGGIVTETDLSAVRFRDQEIVSIGMHRIEDAAHRLNAALAGRIIAALAVVEQGGVALCENGKRIA
jgi:8-oxo-dGTP pyrophosphatase MutT (NUDIX family)